MSEEVNFVDDWSDEKTQCKNCKSYQLKDNKHGCVPEGENFEQAVEKYGEVTPTGHCDYFDPKK